MEGAILSNLKRWWGRPFALGETIDIRTLFTWIEKRLDKCVVRSYYFNEDSQQFLDSKSLWKRLSVLRQVIRMKDLRYIQRRGDLCCDRFS